MQKEKSIWATRHATTTRRKHASLLSRCRNVRAPLPKFFVSVESKHAAGWEMKDAPLYHFQYGHRHKL